MSKIITSLKNMMGFEDDYIYEDEYYDEDLNMIDKDYETFDDYKGLTKKSGQADQDKIVNLHKNNIQVNIVKPKNFDEAPQICDDLKAQKILVVNTTGLEPKTAQRLLDFIAGSSYALGGDLQEVEHGIFILTPSSVNVSNELKEEVTAKGFLNWK